MKIAVVVAFPPNSTWHGTFPLMEGFRELGNTVTVYNAFNDECKYTFENFEPLLASKSIHDLILVLDIGFLKDDRLHTRHYPCPIFGECGDDPQAHERNLQCAVQYDVLLTPQRSYVEKYKRLGWKHTYWWTHSYDHHVHKPYPDVCIEFDVTTAMHEVGRRANTLHLLKSSVFTFQNGVGVEGEEYSRFLQKGKIVFNQSNHNELTRRVFEAMASGRMLLTDKIPEDTGIYDLFTPGVHFDIYEGQEQLMDKIKYYLWNDTEREKIAKAGLEEVSEKHSALGRAQQILNIYNEL